MTTTRLCAKCDKPIPTSRHGNSVTCSERCRIEWDRTRRKESREVFYKKNGQNEDNPIVSMDTKVMFLSFRGTAKYRAYGRAKVVLDIAKEHGGNIEIYELADKSLVTLTAQIYADIKLSDVLKTIREQINLQRLEVFVPVAIKPPPERLRMPDDEGYKNDPIKEMYVSDTDQQVSREDAAWAVQMLRDVGFDVDLTVGLKGRKRHW